MASERNRGSGREQRQQERKVKAQGEHESEMKAQVGHEEEGVRKEEDANSAHEESHVSDRHMTWWRNAW